MEELEMGSQSASFFAQSEVKTDLVNGSWSMWDWGGGQIIWAKKNTREN